MNLNTSHCGFLGQVDYELPLYLLVYEHVLNTCDNNFRSAINSLVVNETTMKKKLPKEKLNKIRYIYSLFSFLSHKYLFCDTPTDELPTQLSVPLYLSANSLKMPCALTHASVNLYNWTLVDNTKDICYENIHVLNTFTNSEYEKNYYKTSIVMEGYFSNLINILTTNTDNLNETHISQVLIEFKSAITKSTSVLANVYNTCPKEYFYDNLKKYYQGFTNVTLRTVDNIVISYDGESGAQITLMWVLYKLMDVPFSAHMNAILNKHKNNMPTEHLDFLNNLNNYENIREIINKSKNSALVNLFTECQNKFKTFNTIHIGIMHKYDNHGEITSVNNENNIYLILILLITIILLLFLTF